MKKALAYLILCLIPIILSAQYQPESLDGSWYKISAYRVDGSRIIDHSGLGDSFIKLDFEGEFVHTTNSIDIESYSEYTLDQGLLSIGDARLYKIESLNSELLVLLDYSEIESATDKLNRYQFVRLPNYVKHLKSNELLTFTNDSTILSNKYIFPFCPNLGKTLNSQLGSDRESGYYMGSILINSKGDVAEVKINDRESLSDEFDMKFIEAMKATSSKWILPESFESCNFIVPFVVKLFNHDFGSIVSFIYFTQDPTPFKDAEQVSEKKDLANRHYLKGNSAYNRKKYEKAINLYTLAIQNDSLLIDARYNRAATYFQIQDLENACSDWGYLEDHEQKGGTDYYNTYCK